MTLEFKSGGTAHLRASSSLAEFVSEKKALSVHLKNFKRISFELKFKYSLFCFYRKSMWPLTILLAF